jgi:hypothetical protein
MNLLEERLQLLSEEITHTVFHATDLSNLYNILASKSFSLSPVSESGLEKHPVNKDKYKFYMSLARSMSSSYTKGFVYAGSGAVIEFDGKKLSQRYRGKAVDWYAMKKEDIGAYYDETEDRLYSKKSTIPDIEKYIKAVHMLAPFKDEKKERSYYRVLEMERSFPIYLYKDKKDMLFVRRNKADKV